MTDYFYIKVACENFLRYCDHPSRSEQAKKALYALKLLLLVDSTESGGNDMIELTKPLEDMTLEELKVLEQDIHRLLYKVIEQQQGIHYPYKQFTPPTLGITVSEKIDTKDKPR